MGATARREFLISKGWIQAVLLVVLFGLLLLLLLVELARHHSMSEAGLTCTILLVAALAGRWLGRDLRAHPANFPEPSLSQGLGLEGIERP